MAAIPSADEFEPVRQSHSLTRTRIHRGIDPAMMMTAKDKLKIMPMSA